jgi:hypothetical protein
MCPPQNQSINSIGDVMSYHLTVSVNNIVSSMVASYFTAVYLQQNVYKWLLFCGVPLTIASAYLSNSNTVNNASNNNNSNNDDDNNIPSF